MASQAKDVLSEVFDDFVQRIWRVGSERDNSPVAQACLRPRPVTKNT